MRFSAFSAFGHLEFRGSDPLARRIYEEKKRNIGYEINFPDDVNVAAELYADAMLEASIRNLAVRASNEAHPLYTVEFLAAHELENGIVPLPTQTISQRQTVLYNTKRLIIDGHFSTISQSLKDLLGVDLLFYRVVRVNELPDIVEYGEDDENRALFTGWHVPIRIDRTVLPITRLNQPIDVVTERVAGNENYYRPRQTLLIEPSSNSRAERIIPTVTRTTSINNPVFESIRAVFKKPHDAGSLIRSGHYPRYASPKRIHQIVLNGTKAIDVNVRHSIDTIMRRLVRGTAVWQICEINSGLDGTGPFILDSSHLDACTIAEVNS